MVKRRAVRSAQPKPCRAFRQQHDDFAMHITGIEARAEVAPQLPDRPVRSVRSDGKAGRSDCR